MKVGEIKNISYKLYEVGDVAVADPEGETALQIGDEIHRVTDISIKAVLLIKGKSGYYHAQLLTRNEIK